MEITASPSGRSPWWSNRLGALAMMRKLANLAFFLLVGALIYWNAPYLWRRTTSLLAFLELEKPTLVFVLDENECVSCLEGLSFLNELYTELVAQEILDLKVVVLSKNGRDCKEISRWFHFPVVVSDDFSLLESLNLNQTPILTGITAAHRIIWLQPLPSGIIEPDELREGALACLMSHGFSNGQLGSQIPEIHPFDQIPF